MGESEGQRESVASRGCGYVGCALVIILIVGLGAGLYFGGAALEPLADRLLWQPHDVVREYFVAHERGETERASRFLCRRLAEPLDPLAPFGRGAGQPYVEDQTPYPRGGGRVAIYYRVDQHGPRAQALLEREDSGWRICGFE